MRGYKEEGTTTTPFDMVVLNDLDRFHLVGDVIDRVPQLGAARRLCQAGDPRQADRAQAYIRQHGEDMPEISGLALVVDQAKPGWIRRVKVVKRQIALMYCAKALSMLCSLSKAFLHEILCSRYSRA